MTLKTYVEDIESVDETLRDYYKQNDNGEGYILNAEPVNGYVIENVEGLRSALTKERARANDFEKKFGKVSKQFEGVDLDEIESLRAEHDKLLKKYERVSKIDPESEAAKLAEEKIKEFEEKTNTTWTKKQKDWQKQYEQEVGAREEKINSLTGQLHNLMVVEGVTTQLTQAGVRPEYLGLVRSEIIKSVALETDENGKLNMNVVDADKNPRVRSDGHNMDLSDLIKEAQGSMPDLFNANSKGGSGSLPNHKATKPAQQGELSPQEKILAGMATLKR